MLLPIYEADSGWISNDAVPEIETMLSLKASQCKSINKQGDPGERLK